MSGLKIVLLLAENNPNSLTRLVITALISRGVRVYATSKKIDFTREHVDAEVVLTIAARTPLKEGLYPLTEAQACSLATWKASLNNSLDGAFTVINNTHGTIKVCPVTTISGAKYFDSGQNAWGNATIGPSVDLFTYLMEECGLGEEKVEEPLESLAIADSKSPSHIYQEPAPLKKADNQSYQRARDNLNKAIEEHLALHPTPMLAASLFIC